MSSESTIETAANVPEVMDRVDEEGVTPCKMDTAGAQESTPGSELFATGVEPSVDDRTIDEVITTPVVLESEALSATDDELSHDMQPALTSDMLGQQLEQLVRSVGVVEELSRRARETAAGDLALYDALLASQRQYSAGLEQTRGIRDQAREVLERAFGQDARAAAQPLVAEADQVLQAFTQLASAWQQRAADFLAEHPDVQVLLAERQLEHEQARQQEATAARAHRLEVLVTSSDEAIGHGLLVEGRRLLAALEREFPEQMATIDRLRLKLERSARAEKDATAREALAQATEHQARGDLETAVSILEQVDVHGLSEDVSQDAFGRWSDTCSRLAQTAGAVLVRFAPAQGRGLILYADPAYPNGLVVFSSLGMGPGFPQGKVVTDAAVLRRARPFREATPLPLASWASAAASAPAATSAPPIRHWTGAAHRSGVALRTRD